MWSDFERPISAAALLASVLISIRIVYLFVRKRKWNYPVQVRTFSPPTPLETDQAERDKVLRRPFNEDQVVGERWDAIVIGSGIGGLTTAALLSKSGMKVLVLEKHSSCGGACHTFNVEGYEFNVGIHYVGDMGSSSSFGKTFLDHVTNGQLQWAPLDTNYDVLVMGAMSRWQRQYAIPSGKDAWFKRLEEDFPSEKVAINWFFSMLNKVTMRDYITSLTVVKTLPLWVVRLCDRFGLFGFFSYFFSLNQQKLSHILVELPDENQDLKQLLTYMWMIYGTPPSQVSFAFHAACYNLYKDGAYFPVGGASEIPYRIAALIEKAGGCVMMKAPIDRILTDSRRRVTGVRVGDVEIQSSIVISDAGVYNTFMQMLPEKVAKQSPIWPVVSNAKPGIGVLSVFLGLKGTAEELGLTAQNIFVLKGNDCEKDLEAYHSLTLREALDMQFPYFVFASSSAKDPSWQGRFPGRSTVTIMTYVPYSWFKKWSNLEPVTADSKPDDEYESIKHAIGQKLIDQLGHMNPKIKDAIDYVCVSTPAAHEYYLNAHLGSAYGLDNVSERFDPCPASLLRSTTGIEGLYMVGQDILSAGLVASAISGLMCAGTILGQWIELAPPEETEDDQKETKKSI